MSVGLLQKPEEAEASPKLRLVAESTAEYGRYDVACLSVDQIVVVSQIRPSTNPVQEELVEDIAANGLGSQLDVAVLSRDRMEDYLGFVKEIWKDETDINELTPDEAGNYHLLIAGHSRLSAIKTLDKRRRADCEDSNLLFQPANVWCKLHHQPSPQEIVSFQISENIHERPPAERTAMVLVENFEYGKRHGLWATKAQYLRSCEGKFSKYALDQALRFADLPQKVRDFTFSGRLRYQTAVALGKQRPLLAGYYRKRFELDDQQMVDRLIEVWYGRRVMAINAKGLAGAAARKYIDGQVASYKAYLANEEPQLAVLFDPYEQAEEYRQQQIKAYRRELATLEAKPLEHWQKAVNLHRAIIGEKPDQVDIEAAHRRLASATADLGIAAMAIF